RRTLFTDTIVVIGNVDFLHSLITPGVAVHGTVEDIGVIGSTQVVCRRNRGVITQVGRTTHTTLASVIAPAIPRIDNLVQGFVNQDGTTGKTRRRLGKRQIVKDDVVQLFLTALGAVEVEEHFLLRRHQTIITVGLNSHFTGSTGNRNTAPASQVVPDNLPGLFFIRSMKNRKRVAPESAFKTF